MSSNRVSDKQLAEYLSNRFNFDIEFSKNIIKELIAYITINILNGNKVTLYGLGSIYLVPSSKAKAGYRLKIKPATKFKESLR